VVVVAGAWRGDLARADAAIEAVMAGSVATDVSFVLERADEIAGGGMLPL
jgi:hypothetical protein